MIADAERLDLASASSAGRRRRCVGSENLIRELRANGLLAELPADSGALSGSLVHSAWAGNKVALNGNQALTLEELQRLESMVLADWAGQEVFLIGREQRLWYHEGIEPRESGQYDVAYGKRQGRDVLLLDAKTLYGEVDPAEHNDQLRELVALFYFNYPLTESIRVAILAPKLQERCTVADYDRFEMELAFRLMRLSLDQAADPQAPRTPGNHCRLCPAKLNCQEVRSLVGSTSILAKRIENGEYQVPIGEKGSRYLDNIKTSKAILHALEERYKTILEETPEAIPGWRLKPGKKVRVITEVANAYDASAKVGFAVDEFWACCDLSITRLAEKLGELTATKGKTLARKFDQAFGELVTYKQYGPELERLTKRSEPELPLDEPQRLLDQP